MDLRNRLRAGAWVAGDPSPSAMVSSAAKACSFAEATEVSPQGLLGY